MKNNISKEMKREIIKLFNLYGGKDAHEMFNIKYGTNYNYRSLQQIYTNYSLGYEDHENLVSNSKEEEHLLKLRQRAKIEQKKSVLLNTENHKMLRELGMSELILDKFEKKINEFDLNKKANIKVEFTNDETCVFFKSDDHFRGTEDDKIVQRNFYEHIFSVAKRKKAKNISLIFGGDECEGMLHVSTLKYTSLTPEEQMVSFVEETIAGLNKLTNEFKVNLYMVTSSNHNQSRHLNSGRNEFLSADLSILMAEMIKIAFKNNDMIDIDAKPVFRGREIAGLKGKKVAITHGGLKFESNAKELIAHYNDSDLILKGHTHVFDVKEIKDKMIITAPTLKTFVTEYEIGGGYISNKESFNANDYKWDSEYLELKSDETGSIMVAKRKVK